MVGSERRHEELDRYLLDGEQLVTAVHQHWGKVAEPVLSGVAALILAFWVDARIDPTIGWVSTLVWWFWFAVALRTAYRIAEWRHDWFVATDKRLLLFYGFITRKVSMMPLMKVTDMSYERSVPGRILGYGRFVMESAGQDQALREVNWVPQPDEHYRAICAEIFGTAVHDQDLFDAPFDDYGDGRDDRWGDGPPPPQAGLPDPYDGWDSPRHSPAGPTAPPRPGSSSQGSLYRSPDLRARDRSADTGPIPIRQRQRPHPRTRPRHDQDPHRDLGDD
ncbi:PH domain-containing protein [Pedococcus dokdonensis]|uniref:PH domain-containing protein n=1 Tax=Pedococcus dokdonensis TaxID=443156 RepID=A0A1H0UE40_9MICO|nr:PH domain-containing protein [Pedococcus dokdonensis]SDP64258.1 PH domain-containing protein [Pedococcus dokdonensis]